MTALPVAHYLKELSGEVQRRGGRGFAALGGGEDVSELGAQLADAHARGVAEGRAAAQAEHEAALAQQAAAFEQKLAAERARWAEEQGVHLGGLIAAGLQDLETRISHVVGETLKPVLVAQARARALEELSRVLNGMLSKGAYARITVQGPADLIAAMQARLGEHPGLSFAAAEVTDLTVTAGETVLATRIGAWADAIAGVDQ
jgi:hypothetical protein